MHPDGVSGEHYHTIEEYIVQIAGTSYIRLRSVDDLEAVNVVEMKAGNVLRIDPFTVHVVTTRLEGSITVPMKQLRKRQRDHFFVDQKELEQEAKRNDTGFSKP